MVAGLSIGLIFHALELTMIGLVHYEHFPIASDQRLKQRSPHFRRSVQTGLGQAAEVEVAEDEDMNEDL